MRRLVVTLGRFKKDEESRNKDELREELATQLLKWTTKQAEVPLKDEPEGTTMVYAWLSKFSEYVGRILCHRAKDILFVPVRMIWEHHSGLTRCQTKSKRKKTRFGDVRPGADTMVELHSAPEPAARAAERVCIRHWAIEANDVLNTTKKKRGIEVDGDFLENEGAHEKKETESKNKRC